MAMRWDVVFFLGGERRAGVAGAFFVPALRLEAAGRVALPEPAREMAADLPAVFLWPAIPGVHPSGRRSATSKIAPGDFLTALRAVDAFLATDFPAVDLPAVLLPTAFLEPAGFRAGAFLAGDFWVATFLAVVFFVDDFLATAFFAVVFPAGDFFAVAFLAVVFLPAAFFGVAAFLAAGLRAVVFFDVVDFFTAFLPADAFFAVVLRAAVLLPAALLRAAALAGFLAAAFFTGLALLAADFDFLLLASLLLATVCPSSPLTAVVVHLDLAMDRHCRTADRCYSL